MAKGARASTKKENNRKLKSKVFGPVEDARTARLSAKLLELVSQPKPKPADSARMEVEDCTFFSSDQLLKSANHFTASAEEKTAAVPESKQADGEEKSSIYDNFQPANFHLEMEMEVDGGAKANAKKSKGRIEKRRPSSRKASIVFPRYKAGKKIGKSKEKK